MAESFNGIKAFATEHRMKFFMGSTGTYDIIARIGSNVEGIRNIVS